MISFWFWISSLNLLDVKRSCEPGSHPLTSACTDRDVAPALAVALSLVHDAPYVFAPCKSTSPTSAMIPYSLLGSSLYLGGISMRILEPTLQSGDPIRSAPRTRIELTRNVMSTLLANTNCDVSGTMICVKSVPSDDRHRSTTTFLPAGSVTRPFVGTIGLPLASWPMFQSTEHHDTASGVSWGQGSCLTYLSSTPRLSGVW